MALGERPAENIPPGELEAVAAPSTKAATAAQSPEAKPAKGASQSQAPSDGSAKPPALHRPSGGPSSAKTSKPAAVAPDKNIAAAKTSKPDKAAADETADGDDETPSRRRWFSSELVRQMEAWTFSMLIHMLILIVGGLWIIPIVAPGGVSELFVSLTNDQTAPTEELIAETAAPQSEFATNALSTAVSGGSGPAGGAGPQSLATTAAPASLQNLVERADAELIRPLHESNAVASLSGADLSEELTKEVRRSAAGGGVREATGVQGAVDGVLSGIRGAMEGGDLLVVWLVDGSISLYNDRQEIASRMEPFYRELGSRDPKQSYKLMNAVVAFGHTTAEVVGPTSFGPKIVDAVRTLPIDATGRENTMSAVQTCVRQYGRRWKGGILVVIWTDESGDDIVQGLEPTIEMCRKRKVTVSAVGPSAVLGSYRGSHLWIDPRNGNAYRLPVTRGPDTCLPEKIAVPYWHDAALPPWAANGLSVAAGMPWYGGPHREGLLSGIGPFGLTRLTLETGGTYTILDHEAEKAPYRLDQLTAYLPDYRSAAEYIKDVQARPLRKAVSDAVLTTYHEVNNITPPVMNFALRRNDRYPFGVIDEYRTPADFRERLFKELPKEQTVAHAASIIIEQALAKFPEKGMEIEYVKEESPRWRAWYDLNRGRLLAMSVRHLEYILACDEIKKPGFLGPNTNRLSLKPATIYRAGPKIEARALEAARLLKRCVAENKNTPWELLAAWELAHPLGLEIKQIVIPPPKPGPPGPPGSPAPPVPTPPFL